MTNHFQNEKNLPYNGSAGVNSCIELDSNHNQMNSNSVIDLMATRDDEVSQFVVAELFNEFLNL